MVHGAVLMLLCLCAGLTVQQEQEISIKNEKRYTEKYPNSSITYTTCKETHNAKVEDAEEIPEDYPEGEWCDIRNIPTNVTKMYPGVRACCPSGSALDLVKCGGTDKDGKPAFFKEVDACVNDDKIVESRMLRNCSEVWPLKEGVLADVQLKENNSVISIDGVDHDQFCLAIKCDSGDENWEYIYEACRKCKYAGELAKLPIWKDPTPPKCCGSEGILDIKTTTCIPPANLSSNITDKISSCNYKNQKTVDTIELTNQTDLTTTETICISPTSECTEIAVTCNQDCKGTNNCIQLCSHSEGKAQALDNDNKAVIYLPEDYDLHAILGVSKDTKLSTKQNKMCDAELPNHITFYPDLCQDIVEFQKDGSIKLEKGVKTENGEIVNVVRYGEFCIQPLSGNTTGSKGKYVEPTGKTGRYKIQTCLKQAKTNNTKEPEKNQQVFGLILYPVISSISMFCLLATIAVYTTWRTALLRSEYNKIMMNLAASLLLAFLTLVVMQLLDSQELTMSLCTGLTLTNQFAFLSAFSHLTLMSVNIGRQIYGMRVRDKGGKGFRREVILAYTIPAVITLLTLIVEYTAPRCANFRPKFGIKSCHFFGELDKFLWLYLPILVLLIINTAMFFYITYNIFKNKQTQNLSGKQGRKEKFDKMCIYLRLFLGMGILWYFEILAFALRDAEISSDWLVFTNILNLMQGVWVFVTFVCKRNVLNVVRGSSERLYSVVAKSMSRGQLSQMKSFDSRSKPDEDKTMEFSMSSVAPAQAEATL